jgi:hypothetical protein
MRYELGAALLAAVTLSGCAGPHGNPNARPYATDPGGMVAVSPQAVGTATYDPYGKVPGFTDMDIGSSATAPSATPPMYVTPQGAAPAPQRGRMRNGPTQQ